MAMLNSTYFTNQIITTITMTITISQMTQLNQEGALEDILLIASIVKYCKQKIEN